MFHNVVFPLSVERCVSTARWQTTVVELGNRREVRISHWDDAQVKFNASLGVRSLADLQTLLKFHHCRKGRAFSFPVRDLVDHKVAVGAEGTFAAGDGTAGPFQLSKSYTDAGNTDVRKITKPEQGTVRIYVDGVPKTEGVHYTVNYLTGKVTFTAGNFPGAGAVLEWSGRFYVPVRFTEDELPADEFVATMTYDAASDSYLVTAGSANVPAILMVEVDE